MGPLIVLAMIFVLLLWLAITVRRRMIHTMLMTTGHQVTGTATLVWPRGSGAARIGVTYVDNNGGQHTAIKALVSAGDAELMKKTPQVIFHPLRADRDDYVLLGFGERPTTWFRASFPRG